MKYIFPLLTIIFFLILGSACERINAGYTGIKVNLYGSDKGISDITEVEGMVWYNPFTVDVYEVPTFVQNAVYTVDENEGSPVNEEFRVTTNDGMVVKLDVSINYLIPRENAVQIFSKYRKPPHELDKTIMRNYLREAFNTMAGKYNASSLYERRNEFSLGAEQEIKKLLEPEGFVVEQVVLLNELRLPPSVVSNIEQKINAEQTALMKQEELNSAKADAEKKIATARGNAESVLIEARSQAEANKVLSASITKDLLTQQWIKKWDGKMPQYTAGNQSPVPFMQVK